MGGQSNQWKTPLYDGTTPVELQVPPDRQGHYTLNDALADKCIEWLHEQKSVTPDRPFFVYFAPGATHAPHHVPPEWLARFKGQFDQGYDKYREETFERQKQLGLVPADARLTPRPKEIPPYDALTPDQKKAAARLMEAFAAFTAQTDYEVGRLVETLEQMGPARQYADLLRSRRQRRLGRGAARWAPSTNGPRPPHRISPTIAPT